METNNKMVCEECGKTLFGRVDKRFCADDCRNAFNRKKRQEEKAMDHENIPLIIKTIKRNYEILRSYKPHEQPESSYSAITLHKLVAQGFNPHFCTAASLDGEGKLWKYCFDIIYGIENDYCYFRQQYVYGVL
ncbi:hypothetical protein [Pedobacter aquatilis]|uniref:hypothetical protein n=1 Tax=Pedobacter aquatilis TaxID=351343 RepID=UPI00292FCDFF|nr:hypothetical protein [Pedobacter aquatilis]